MCSTLCYLLPPNGPLSPGSQACLTPFFPPGHVIPPYWPKEHGREAFLGGGGFWDGNCLPPVASQEPRVHSGSSGLAGFRKCPLEEHTVKNYREP